MLYYYYVGNILMGRVYFNPYDVPGFIIKTVLLEITLFIMAKWMKNRIFKAGIRSLNEESYLLSWNLNSIIIELYLKHTKIWLKILNRKLR